MHLPLWMIDWNSKEKGITAVLVIIFIIFILGWVDVTFGTAREVSGKVTKIGIDSANYYKLSEIVATVMVRKNAQAIVNMPLGTNVNIGDTLILIERDMYFTNGSRFLYVRKNN